MGTPASEEEKIPATKHGFAHTAALPPSYQLAIEDTAFRMHVLDERGARDYDCDCALIPPAWFSVTIAASTQKRYLYLVQKETGTGLVVLILLFDRATTSEDSNGLRLPPGGAWLRAVVDGAVYVLASDLVLSRKSITAWIGGHEPPTTPARPPYT
jgi:hypothetical protein